MACFFGWKGLHTTQIGLVWTAGMFLKVQQPVVIPLNTEISADIRPFTFNRTLTRISKCWLSWGQKLRLRRSSIWPSPTHCLAHGYVSRQFGSDRADSDCSAETGLHWHAPSGWVPFNFWPLPRSRFGSRPIEGTSSKERLAQEVLDTRARLKGRKQRNREFDTFLLRVYRADHGPFTGKQDKHGKESYAVGIQEF